MLVFVLVKKVRAELRISFGLAFREGFAMCRAEARLYLIF